MAKNSRPRTGASTELAKARTRLAELRFLRESAKVCDTGEVVAGMQQIAALAVNALESAISIPSARHNEALRDELAAWIFAVRTRLADDVTALADSLTQTGRVP
jgi:hypothetical protein